MIEDVSLGEIKLFRAVLRLAASDAFLARSTESKSLRALNKSRALFFFSDEKDLSTVCDLACVEYAAVRKIVSEAETSPNEKYRKLKALLKA